MIKGAPLSVVTLMIASLVAGWIFASYYYSERIAVLESRLGLKDELSRMPDQGSGVTLPSDEGGITHLPASGTEATFE